MPDSETGEIQEMQAKSKTMNNSEHLLKYLEDNSLAAKLVRAHGDRDPAHPEESMKIIIRERLNQMRESIDDTED